MEQTSITEQSSPPSMVETPPAPAPVETTYTKTEVDKMIRHANANVADKVRRELLAQTATPAPAPQPEHQAQPQQAPASVQGNQIGGMPDIRSLVQQELQQQRSMQFYENMAQGFESRMKAAKESYSDFDDVTQGFPFVSYPHSIVAAMNFENTADIMYDLAKNPVKIETMESLGRRDTENSQRGIYSNLASREMQKISEAIRINKQAATVKTANPPLSQLQPSPSGVDNGSVHDMSVSDFQRSLLKKSKR